MRLKDPLQGIMLMQGHFVMHFSVFLGSFFIYPKVTQQANDTNAEMQT